MSRNVELKAQLAELTTARKIAAGLCGSPPEHLEQVDTYFHSSAGRLKLREIDGQASQLIWYARPDDCRPRTSTYELVTVSDAPRLKRALESALGIRVVVAKTREVFLDQNVRIHLDQVQRLGSFIEFEAVLEDAAAASQGEEQVRELARTFGLREDQLVARSYSDLLLELES